MTRTKDQVIVIGAGTMGRGIAQVVAQAGFLVAVQDVSDPVLAQAQRHIEATLAKGVELGKVRPEDAAATRARLAYVRDAGTSFAKATWIIEAVPERVELKQQVFRDAASRAGPDTLLATNTSSLSITRISESVPDPERLVGLHFFNPPHLLRLLEVVRGAKTAKQTVDAAVAFARRLGKEPIVVRDAPGFASTRLGLALGLEAIRMVEQGVASAADIDKSMELGYNHPMGPLKLTDLVGLDVRLSIAEFLHRELQSDAFRPPELLRKLVAQGRLGRKAGRGFYEYETEAPR